MAKIAALILPPSRAHELDRLCTDMAALLGVSGQAGITVHNGREAVCGLVGAGTDPLNSQARPIETERGAGVACGYYVSDVGHVNGNSARRLVEDVLAEPEIRLARNDGVYAFACWDSHNEKLIAGVDKLGMRPLFWTAVKGGGYAFASEIKALMPLIGEIEPNWQAWEEYLTFGFLFGDHTPFSGISRLGPANVMRCGASRHQVNVVENFLADIEIRERPFDSFIEEQGAVFDGTMRTLSSLYNAENDTLLTMSGGYDSRRAMAWMLENDIPFDAWTVPEIKADGSEFESGIVRELCARAGVAAYTIYPRSVEERRAIGSRRTIAADFESDEHNYATILAQAVNGGNKINFDGLGAGSQLMASFMKPEYFEPDGEDRFIADWPLGANSAVKLPETDPPLEVRLRKELNQWGDHPNRFAYFYLMSRTRREVALAPLSIQAANFESVCPYLGRDMMRSALSFPPEKKVGADAQRHLIKAANPALAAVPFAHDIGSTESIAYSRVMGSIDRRARQHCFFAAARTGWKSKGIRMPLKQRLDLSVCACAPWLVSNTALGWKINRAERLAQLAWFLSISQTGEQYRNAVLATRSTTLSAASWITST